MANIFRKQKEMTIVGQGGKIILFMLPALIAAILVHIYLPTVAALPEWTHPLKLLGYVLLALGIAFWATAVFQLLTGFSKGNLITTGAYGIVRNPIYCSVALFILPAVTLITSTWVYIVVSLFLYTGVEMYIRKEEEQLTRAFGKPYRDYLARVDRFVPFRKPGIRKPAY